MIITSLIFVCVMWLAVGCFISLMAGGTHKFDTRFFPAHWLIPMGPVGMLVWYTYAQYEKKDFAKAERARKRKK